MNTRLLGLIFIISLYTFQAFGWGTTGHRVVGKIAEQHLSDKARLEIKKILNNESLAIASTWADFIKSDKKYDHTHKWHYVSIPDGQTYGQSEKAEADIIEAIDRLTKQLKDPSVRDEDRLIALRFIIHLVGDIHQPLHVGKKEDRGGNKVPFRWFGSETNLHSVWDSKIIDFQDLSYTELSESINYASNEQITKWQNSTVLDWANESYNLRRDIYSSLKNPGSPYRYNYIYYPIIEQQLLKAGIRLAGILNKVFEEQS